MANLGNIWFNLGAKDNTDKDLEKIVKKIEGKEIKIALGIDDERMSEALRDALKDISKTKDDIESSDKSSSNSSKEQEKSSLALLRNEEKILRAKERMVQLLRRISLSQYEGTEEMKKAYEWVTRTTDELNKIPLDDDEAIISKTGASLSESINHYIHKLNELKKADKAAKKQLSSDDTGKSYKKTLDDTERLERALLRVRKVKNRIENDPFRMQEGYKEVYAQIEKIRAKLESLRGASSREIKLGTGTSLANQIQDVEVMIAKQDQLYRDTTKQTTSMTRMWGQLGSQIKKALSVYAIQGFVKQLITMGGEFEKQHYALRAIIGDLGKADQIFNNLRRVAVKSPFHFGDFTGFAKQLAAFSIPVNEIYDTTKRLADVSAGLGVDMGRIILAYGQIRAASFLRGQEVRQLTEAGIPIIEELAKKLTDLKGVVVSTGEVFDSISRREVPFEMVKEVFQDLTDEGGKFYNMQEKLAESLSGKWANLTSYFQLMLYDISQEQNGALHMLIETLTYLTKNFRLVESAIYGMITAFAAGKVLHWVEAFRSMSMEAKRLLVHMRRLGRAIISTRVLVTGGLGALTGVLSYVYAKQSEFNKGIAEITATSYELESSMASNMNAFIGLAEKEGEAAEMSAERHKILLDIAKTEPEVAKEIRAHANNTAYLTDKLKEYVAAKRAARDAEIGFAGESWLSDTMEDTEVKINRAKDNIAKINIAARKSFAELMMALEGKELGDYMLDRYGSTWSDEVISNLSNVLSDINKTAEDKWKEFNEIAYKYIKDVSGSGAASVFYQRISAFEGADKRYRKAAEEFNERVRAANITIMQSLDSTFKKEGIKEGSDEFNKIIYETINSMTSASDQVKEALFESFNIDPSVYKKNLDMLDGWKAEIDKILEGVVTITKDTSVEDAVSSVTSAIKSTKDYIEGIDEAKLKRAIETQSKGWLIAEASLKKLLKSKDDLERLEKAMDVLGAIGKTSGASTRDPFADKMAKRVKLIKDASSYYEKYIGLLGRAGALEKVRSDKRFSDLNFTPESVKDMLSDVYNQLSDSKEQKKVKDLITETFTDIDFNKVKESVNKLAENIKRLVKENSEKFKLFDSIIDTTGNEVLAKEMVFAGKQFAASYTDFLKRILSDEVGAENIGQILGLDPDTLRDNYSDPIIKLVEDINNETDKIRAESVKRQIEAINATATLQEKADAIRLRYERDISMAVNERASEALTESMNKELSELYSQAIQLSPLWRELFGDVSDYSYRMLKNLVAEAKKLANTAKEVKDSDGNGTGMFELTGDDGQAYIIKGEEYTRMLKAIASKSDEIAKRNPFGAFAKSWSEFIEAPNGLDKEKSLTKLIGSASAAADEVSGIASAFSDMFDSLGNEELAETLELVGDISNSLGDIASGFAQGGVVGGVTASLSAIPNIIGSIAKSHDKKLDRKIRKSALEVQRLQAAYDKVNREVERQLGAMTRGQVDKQIDSLRKQVQETYYMMNKERNKKKSDEGKIRDYERQIEELNEQILFFYEDLASSLYNIDLKGWSNEFSSTIVSAWRNGSDAAKAYEEAANEVLANVANKMVSEFVLEPVFKKLRDKLPDMMDKGHLTKEDMGLLASLLVEVGDQIDKSFDYIDEINDMVEEMSGGSLSLKLKDDIDSNLGKGIQSLQEDTAQLLGSYLNAIRQDVSVNRGLIEDILTSIGTSLSTEINDAIATLKKIEANTLRNANAVDEINSKLEQVMTGARRFSTE